MAACVPPRPAGGTSRAGTVGRVPEAEDQDGRPEDDIDDQDLVVAAQEGSVAAFEVLFRRYRGRVYALALRMTGQPSDAEDVAQDCFITAWRKLDDLENPGAVRTWLSRIATTTALATIRRRKRSVPVPDEALDQERSEDAGPPVRAELTHRLAALQRALLSLPARQRAVWLLVETEGLSYQEAGLALGSSPDVVRGLLFRARSRLAEVMAEWR